MSFHPEIIWEYLWSGFILDGVRITILLAVISQLAGFVLGLFAALGRLSRVGPFRWLAGLYIWFFRGTPLLVQILFVYFALPQLTGGNITLGALTSAFLALALNEGAYMAEIIRAGISAVEAGQMEAAESLGMTRGLAMRRIVLPQAIRVIIPPTGNEFISMLKNTSLAYVIAAEELLFKTTQLINATQIYYFELYAVASIWYLAMTTVTTYLQSLLERRYERGFRREVREAGLFQRMMTGALRRG